MKNSISKILALVMMMIFAGAAHANDEKYIETMKKNIDALYNAKDIASLQSVVNTLERIASVEKTKWEPLYYSAYGNVMTAFYEQDGAKKDAYLDLALASLTKAKEILPNDSEITALEGFVHMIRVTVDPGSRGPQYAGLSMQLFGKASALNPENPRALTLMAQMQYGTAQFFGSPTTDACVTLDQALAKFDTFKSDNPLAPQWGRHMAMGLKEHCK
jgi:hypothetical protein